MPNCQHIKTAALLLLVFSPIPWQGDVVAATGQSGKYRHSMEQGKIDVAFIKLVGAYTTVGISIDFECLSKDGLGEFLNGNFHPLVVEKLRCANELIEKPRHIF